MSVPVSYCRLVQAADDTEVFKMLHPTMKRNIDGGHFSVWPCEHDPPCRQLTEAEVRDLFSRFRADLFSPVEDNHA